MSSGLSESVSECKTVSVAQLRVLAREAEVRYHGRTTTRRCESNWEVSAAFPGDLVT